MIRVNKEIVVDGAVIWLSAEGGSAKEALAIIEREADDLGAALSVVSPTPAPGGKRTRRTKAEMEAAKAAAAAGGGSQLALPPGFGGENPHPVAMTAGPVSAFDDTTPPMPPSDKSVAFAPPVELPPPPIVDPLEPTREQIDNILKATIALNPAWSEAVHGAFQTHIQANGGGDIFKMNKDQLDKVLVGVTSYHDRVKQALGK